ncbi:MAG: heme exporter protein CcmB [Sedimentisphaerales bacterium]|nr:heme exporter protein CcmB [Sedimentisphaerales bacterium]
MFLFNGIKAIFVKDLVTELRAREVLPAMIVLGMLIVWVLRLVSEVGSMPAQVMGPAALWIAFLFAGLMAQERSFATEQHQDCIYGLLLAPIDPGVVYLAKFLVNISMLCIFEIILVPIVIFTFKLSVQAGLSRLIAILLLGNIAISSVGTLFSAIVHVSRIRGSILSILVLTILLPVMMPATFALLLCFGTLPEELIGTGALTMVGNFKTAIGYLAAFDAIFVTAAWLLFGFVVQE